MWKEGSRNIQEAAEHGKDAVISHAVGVQLGKEGQGGNWRCS